MFLILLLVLMLPELNGRRDGSAASLSTAAFSRPRPRADRVHSIRVQASLHSHSGERWGEVHGSCAASPRTRRVSAALPSLPSITGTAVVTSGGWAGTCGALQPITMRDRASTCMRAQRTQGGGVRVTGELDQISEWRVSVLDSY